MSKNKKGLPPGWKMTTFGELMPEPHWTKFLEMWKRHNGNMDAVTKELRTYLEPFKAEFDARGADTAFLSYYIPYQFNEVTKQQQMQQAAEQAHDSMDLADQIMREQQKKRSQWN